MTKKYRVLVLTDHTGHSDQNSIYALLNQMKVHTKCHSIYIASRGIKQNDLFFEKMADNALTGIEINSEFKFTQSGAFFNTPGQKLNPSDFDMVFLRLPRPISDVFLKWIDKLFQHAVIINKPSGIIETSNKKFLVNFSDLCPELKLCYSIKEIQEEIRKFPIVLKPLREYGGKGILKIDGDQLDDSESIYDTNKYLKKIEIQIQKEGYLSMKFLKNVNQGDKRILVAGDELLAASLRLPKKGTWLCNVSKGATVVKTNITEREKFIISKINPILNEKGILMYGVDTLVDDSGLRVLSEINTLSIGGFPQAEKQSGKPIIKLLLDKMFKYADENR